MGEDRVHWINGVAAIALLLVVCVLLYFYSGAPGSGDFFTGGREFC
jgi:Na+/proline symporter